ncbi:nucleotidyl transferase AbiEii/AbiGii toxin family protein [Nocardia sp. IFM 10818]
MTAGSWENFQRSHYAKEYPAPNAPLSDATRADRHLPRTLAPVVGDGVTQQLYHDIALTHYINGMRLTEPHFADSATGAAWYAARRDALDRVLDAVATTRWVPHLVLRGSILLRAWFGAAAREPGDVDFVVVPQDWQLGDERVEDMFTEIAEQAETTSRAADSTVRFHAESATTDDIWTYGTVPGRRLLLPWTALDPAIPSGSIQIDFVFGQPLVQPPTLTEIPHMARPHTSAVLNAATPEMSLAWKLLWLWSDEYPRGKDLYDAVLLAEHCHLPSEILDRTMNQDADYRRYGGYDELVAYVTAEVDWTACIRDFPQLAGREEELAHRLRRALT